LFGILLWLPKQVKALVCASALSFQEVKNSPRVREDSGLQASTVAVPGRGRGNGKLLPRRWLYWKCPQDSCVLIKVVLGWAEVMGMMPVGR